MGYKINLNNYIRCVCCSRCKTIFKIDIPQRVYNLKKKKVLIKFIFLEKKTIELNFLKRLT